MSVFVRPLVFGPFERFYDEYNQNPDPSPALQTLADLARKAKIVVFGAQNINFGEAGHYGRFAKISDFDRWSSIDENYLGVSGMDPVWISAFGKPVGSYHMGFEGSAYGTIRDDKVDWWGDEFWEKFDNIIKNNRTPPTFDVIFVDRVTLDYMFVRMEDQENNITIDMKVIQKIASYISDGGLLIVRNGEFLKNAGGYDIAGLFNRHRQKFTDIGLKILIKATVLTTPENYEGEWRYPTNPPSKKYIEICCLVKNRESVPSSFLRNADFNLKNFIANFKPVPVV
jgi:hypothetical protein